jgi:hypothetical protein
VIEKELLHYKLIKGNLFLVSTFTFDKKSRVREVLLRRSLILQSRRMLGPDTKSAQKSKMSRRTKTVSLNTLLVSANFLSGGSLLLLCQFKCRLYRSRYWLHPLAFQPKSLFFQRPPYPAHPAIWPSWLLKFHHICPIEPHALLDCLFNELTSLSTIIATSNAS